MNESKMNLTLYYLVFDLFLLNLSFVVAMKLNIDLNQPLQLTPLILFPENLAWIITFLLIPKRNLYLRDGFSNRVFKILKRSLVFVLTSLVIHQFLIGTPIEQRLWWLLPVVLFVCIRLFAYYAIYLYLHKLRSEGRYTKKVCIIGNNSTSKVLAATFKNNKVLGYDFKGFITKSDKEETNEEVLGPLSQLDALIDLHKIETIFVVLSIHESNTHLDVLIKLAIHKGIRIKLVPIVESFFNIVSKSSEQISGIRVIDPLSFPLDKHQNRLVKRTFDLLFSSLVIILLFSWLFPLLALIIKLSSKGPVFFVQERTGISNKTFKCLKFRSMEINADSDKIQSTTNDARITKIGAFLRKTNIDEFPQFLNVWLGQMSVVGPRPHMLFHTNFYKDKVEYYKSRHFIKPGVTGWAQVKGYRGVTDEIWKMEKRVEYDLFYIHNQSFLLDLKIILATVFDQKSYLNAG